MSPSVSAFSEGPQQAYNIPVIASNKDQLLNMSPGQDVQHRDAVVELLCLRLTPEQGRVAQRCRFLPRQPRSKCLCMFGVTEVGAYSAQAGENSKSQTDWSHTQ